MKETINIRSDSKDWRGAILSNLAHTPFTVNGYSFLSVESALQGIKFFDRHKREEIFRLDGLSALRAGRVITKLIASDTKNYVFYKVRKPRTEVKVVR